MLLTPIFVCFAVLVFLILMHYKKHSYWSRFNLKTVTPLPFLGNYGAYITMWKDIGEVVTALCRKHPEEPMFGAYYGLEPVLVVQDPELIKQVLTKDFHYFNGREVSDHTHRESLTRSLFFASDDFWRALRQNMSPLFSSAKLKKMFHFIAEKAAVFEQVLENETTMSPELDIKLVISYFTMDCMSACFLGVESGVMRSRSDGDNPFRKFGDAFFETNVWRGISTHLRALVPSFFYGIGRRLFAKEINTFFNGMLLELMRRREAAPPRHDYVDLMNDIKCRGYVEYDSVKSLMGGPRELLRLQYEDDVAVSQCVALYAAGFETSATTAAFTLFELAKQPELLRRAQSEVDAYLSRGRLDYDCVSLPFLSQCVSEALRLYPVVPVLTREVRAPRALGGVPLPRGQRVHIPTEHLHRSARYFPEPERFRPERFAPENRASVPPFAYLPFGEGPRICIGKRFALMQLTAALVVVLSRYSVRPARDEAGGGGLRSIPTAMTKQPVGGVRLILEPRTRRNEPIADGVAGVD